LTTPRGRANQFDVVVIGAGPAGALAAARLAQCGVRVIILEKQHFPRFVIGESLLPQCMAFLERANLLAAVQNEGFQLKNGAIISRGLNSSSIEFCDKFAPGWASTFQVQRARFDTVLAGEASKAGAILKYGRAVRAASFDSGQTTLSIETDQGRREDVSCRFVVDSSGYGRVLPRLLNLDRPSTFPVRHAYFTHVSDNISASAFDRNKILITIHPSNPGIWYWLIPFSDGTASIGAVTRPEHDGVPPGEPRAILWDLIGQVPELHDLLANATDIRSTDVMKGYSSGVSKLASTQFALLGNAGEFLDPIFSSGVTIALKSADLVVDPLIRQLDGQSVDWHRDFAEPLQVGIDTFRAFVEAWYDGSLQHIVLNPPSGDNTIRRMIVSVLAGYAWDHDNPFVKDSRRYLKATAALCG